MLRTIRLTLAIVFFALVTFLFLDFTGTLHGWMGWMAKIQFLPALLALNAGVVLLLVALTLLFGMPLPAVLPAILLKSVLLAAAAGWAAHRFNRISLPILLAVVLFYQVAGTLGEWAMVGSFFQAVQDFRIGLPGMAMQVVGGYALIKYSASL